MITVVANEDILDALKVMAHPDRIRILQILNRESADPCVTELQLELGMPQSTVSQHLKKLRNVGVLQFERKHLNTYYQISEDSFVLDVLDTLFREDITSNQVEENRQLLAILAHKVRMEMFLYIGRVGEQNVTQLVQTFGMPQSTVSQHLSLMRQYSRILAKEKKGLESYYSVREDREQLKELMNRIF